MSNRRFIDLEVLPATASAISNPLSVREGDILDLIAYGRSNKEIARSLCIAPETVKTHVKHIFIKLNVERRAQAVSHAHSLGLVARSATNRLSSLASGTTRDRARGLSASSRHAQEHHAVRRQKAGPSRLPVYSNGAIDTRGEEVSDLSASAVIRRPGVVDNICGVAMRSQKPTIAD
jgi:DNA-binding CsgD family transcriptional regulator